MQTELDQIANQNHLHLFKAILPHLPASNRRIFSILIKIMEVQNVLNYYTEETKRIYACEAAGVPSDAPSFSGSSSETSAGFGSESLLDILTDVRQYCEGAELELIDQALQMISMIELYSIFAQQEGEPYE